MESNARKHQFVIAAESGFVHFNLMGPVVPLFLIGGVPHSGALHTTGQWLLESFLDIIAASIREGVLTALVREQKRPFLVQSIYAGLQKCRWTWRYKDQGMQPLGRDVRDTIDALQQHLRTTLRPTKARKGS
eukprot:240330-Pelagomonas_calceolata.AAC.7